MDCVGLKPCVKQKYDQMELEEAEYSVLFLF